MEISDFQASIGREPEVQEFGGGREDLPAFLRNKYRMEVCTVDDFREWLSDNLRYILLGLAIIIVLVIAFFAVRFVTDRLGGDSDIKTDGGCDRGAGIRDSSRI